MVARLFNFELLLFLNNIVQCINKLLEHLKVCGYKMFFYLCQRLLLISFNSMITDCSLWDYTNVVMNYLCGNCNSNCDSAGCDSAGNYEWLQNFDVVITGRLEFIIEILLS